MRSALMTVLMRWATMNTVALAVSLLQRGAQPRVGGEVERREAVVEDVDVRLAARSRAQSTSRCFCPPDRLMPPCEIGDANCLRHRVDELDRLRHRRGVAHLLVGRVLAAVADVGGDGSGEEHGLLRDEADPRAQIGLRHLAHVDAVDQHAPVVDVVEARNQPGERRFARAGAADDRRDLARDAP